MSTTYGSAAPAYLSGSESPRSGSGPTVIKDGFGLNPPTLMADPGSVVTITLTDDADAVVAFLGATTLPVAAVDEHTYAVTLPADALLPQSFAFRVDSSGERTLLTDSWVLMLGSEAVAPAPPPVAAPAPIAGPPAATSSARPFRARARRAPGGRRHLPGGGARRLRGHADPQDLGPARRPPAVRERRSRGPARPCTPSSRAPHVATSGATTSARCARC